MLISRAGEIENENVDLEKVLGDSPKLCRPAYKHPEPLATTKAKLLLRAIIYSNKSNYKL